MLSKTLVALTLLASSVAFGQSQTTTTATKAHTSARKVASRTKAARSKKPRAVSQAQLEQIRSDMQRQHEEMQQQIQDLKQQLTESRQQMTQTQQSVAAAAQAAQTNEQASQQAAAASNQAVTSLQGAVSDLKGNTATLATTVQENQVKTKAAIETPTVLHYKGVALTPGGFIAAETVWRQRLLQADIASPFNSIPFDGTAAANLSEFRASAHQSRMSVLAEGKAGTTNLSGYLEFDILGAGVTSNSTESNSYVPRMRHVWMQAAWKDGWSLAAGQMWTLAMSNRKGMSPLSSNAYLPDMIEAQYVVGLNWLRQPSLRVVKIINNHTWVAASAEGAQTTFSARNAPANFLFASPGTTNLTSTVNYSFDTAPDIVAKIEFDPGFGHYELKGLARFFRDRVYPGNPPTAVGAFNDNHLGGGIGAAASWALAKKVDFSLNALVGNGVGRYGTSLLPDVTVRPDGTLAPIHGGQELTTFEFNPNPKLKIYAYGGGEYAGRRAFVNSKGLGVGYGSPQNDNTGCQTEAVPATSTTLTTGKCNADTRFIYQGTLGFWYRPYMGPMGRLQYGLQYSYTGRSAWSGVGGAPNATENMVFTSMRYYIP